MLSIPLYSKLDRGRPLIFLNVNPVSSNDQLLLNIKALHHKAAGI